MNKVLPWMSGPSGTPAASPTLMAESRTGITTLQPMPDSYQEEGLPDQRNRRPTGSKNSNREPKKQVQIELQQLSAWLSRQWHRDPEEEAERADSEPDRDAPGQPTNGRLHERSWKLLPARAQLSVKRLARDMINIKRARPLRCMMEIFKRHQLFSMIQVFMGKIVYLVWISGGLKSFILQTLVKNTTKLVCVMVRDSVPGSAAPLPVHILYCGPCWTVKSDLFQVNTLSKLCWSLTNIPEKLQLEWDEKKPVNPPSGEDGTRYFRNN